MEDRGKTEGATAEFTSKQRDANVPGKFKKTTKGKKRSECLCADVCVA